MALRLSTGLRTMMMGGSLVTNGKFTSDAASWTATDVTLSSVASGQEGNCMKVLESGAGASGYAYQSITVKTGMRYVFYCYFKLGDGTNGTIKVGTSAGDSTYYTSGNITDATWARYQCVFTATGTTCVISLYANQDAKYNYYDEVFLSPLGSLKEIFEGGQIEIYSGTQPSTPDTVPTGTKLVTIKNGSNGITFDAASAGVLSKAAAETWSGTCIATYTAGWFRLLSAGDLGTAITTDYRIDGSVGTSGSQLNVSSTSFVTGAVETITSFTLTLPMA